MDESPGVVNGVQPGLFAANNTGQIVAAISGNKPMLILKRYTHLRTEYLVARQDEVRYKRS